MGHLSSSWVFGEDLRKGLWYFKILGDSKRSRRSVIVIGVSGRIRIGGPSRLSLCGALIYFILFYFAKISDRQSRTLNKGAVLQHVKLTIFMKYFVIHFETCRSWRYSLGLIVTLYCGLLFQRL